MPVKQNPKSNPSDTIRARHTKRTIIQDGKEVLLEMTFTQKNWDHLGSVRIDGKLVPKQGFVRISDVQDPPESKTPAADPVAASTPAAPQQTPPVAPTAPGINVAEIEAAIKAGEKDKLPMAVLIQYVKSQKLAIDAPEKMPQHELIEKIKSLLV